MRRDKDCSKKIKIAQYVQETVPQESATGVIGFVGTQKKIMDVEILTSSMNCSADRLSCVLEQSPARPRKKVMVSFCSL